MDKRLIGIDFGTSTTVMRVKNYDETGKWIGQKTDTKSVVFEDGASMTPTLIRKNETGQQCWYGFTARPNKKNTELYREFKLRLEDSDPALRAQARELTREFFGYLYESKYAPQRQSSQFGNPNAEETTIVSFPVKWSEETRQFMLQAARDAGFSDVRGMDEAEAAIRSILVTCGVQINSALQGAKSANILLIDMGAGTTDLVLCRCSFGDKIESEILSTWPNGGSVFFGGGEVDRLLADYIRDLLDPEDSDSVISKLQNKSEFKAWKEMYVSPALQKADTVRDFASLEELCPIMDIDMPDFALDRAAFETLAQVYLRAFPELIAGCLREGGLQPEDVDLVVLTGGHSNWYFAEEMLRGAMPSFGAVNLRKIKEDPRRIVRTALPQETVAIGLVMNDQLITKPVLPDPVPDPHKNVTVSGDDVKWVSSEKKWSNDPKQLWISASLDPSINRGLSPSKLSVTYGQILDMIDQTNALRFDETIDQLKSDPRIIIQEGVSPIDDKINTFMTASDIQLESDEGIILFYDDTVFGSGKNGALLTTKNFYARGLLGDTRCLSLTKDCRAIYDPVSPTNIRIINSQGHIDLMWSVHLKTWLLICLARFFNQWIQERKD